MGRAVLGRQMGQWGFYGNSRYFPLSFAGNLKLLYKIKSIKFLKRTAQKQELLELIWFGGTVKINDFLVYVERV